MSIRRVGSSPVSRTRSFSGLLPNARVVELADSLDSGSSVLYGRAGSSPASRTKETRQVKPVSFLFLPARQPEAARSIKKARRWRAQVVPKASQSSPPAGGESSEIIFCRDPQCHPRGVAENTSRGASVEWSVKGGQSWGPRANVSKAVCVGRGGARERPQFLPSGRNGG